MRLIDADIMRENLEWCKSQSGGYNDIYWDDVIERLDVQPTVPAVPLEPLLKILDDTETIAPCTLCRKIIPDWCEEHNKPPLIWDKKIDCPTWETLLTKWMEEQDAVD